MALEGRDEGNAGPLAPPARPGFGHPRLASAPSGSDHGTAARESLLPPPTGPRSSSAPCGSEPARRIPHPALGSRRSADAALGPLLPRESSIERASSDGAACAAAVDWIADNFGRPGDVEDERLRKERDEKEETRALAEEAVRGCERGTWDPLHIGSFGVSSPAEAALCLMVETDEGKFELDPENHRILREERGLTLPLVEGDTVEHKGEGAGNVVSSWADDNTMYVTVQFDDGNEQTYDFFNGELAIKGLVPRRPEEVWLRADLFKYLEGRDDKGNEASVVDGKCCVCLEETTGLLSGLCGRRECEAAFCRPCLSKHCDAAIESSRYSAAPIRCPGPGCGLRLPMSAWSHRAPLVSVLQYVHAPRQLMSVRCESCDNVTDLFPRFCAGREERRKAHESIIEGLSLNPAENDKREMMLQLVKSWADLSQGLSTPEKTISRIHDISGPTSEEDKENFLDLMLGRAPGVGEGWGLLSLVVDAERRAALALALLRADPLVWLRCCDWAVCFKCKVSYHEGQTCKERQMEETDIEAQFCPHCGVPTIRTEGCSHIVCVCGNHWEWEEGNS